MANTSEMTLKLNELARTLLKKENMPVAPDSGDWVDIVNTIRVSRREKGQNDGKAKAKEKITQLLTELEKLVADGNQEAALDLCKSFLKNCGEKT